MPRTKRCAPPSSLKPSAKRFHTSSPRPPSLRVPAGEPEPERSCQGCLPFREAVKNAVSVTHTQAPLKLSGPSHLSYVEAAKPPISKPPSHFIHRPSLQQAKLSAVLTLEHLTPAWSCGGSVKKGSTACLMQHGANERHHNCGVQQSQLAGWSGRTAYSQASGSQASGV